jgi:rhodanese-related sulfurtransferase
VLVGDPSAAIEAKVRLARVGYDRVAGQLDEPGNALARPELVEQSSRLTIEALAELRHLEPDLQLVDIRDPGETADGVLPLAREVPLAALTNALQGLDPARPVVVYCASGYRSQTAASALVSRGFSDVSDVIGGYAAWSDAGLVSPNIAEQVTDTPQVSPPTAKQRRRRRRARRCA